MVRKLFYTLICLIWLAGTSFAGSFVVSPKFYAQVDGTPLSGGLVNTYECGGTTAKTTYTTYSEGTANANPVVLSAQGEASIYASGCLKVIVTTSTGAAVSNGTQDYLYSFDHSVIQDKDGDTKIQVEESDDEDIIRFDINGTEKMTIDSDGVHIVGTIYDTGYGRVERPDFVWTDDDTITISAGAYHHSGNSEQLVYWNSAIAFDAGPAGSNASNATLGNSTLYFLYLDDSAIVTQASALLDKDCFLLTSEAPTYNHAKHGWYPATTTGSVTTSDRCIFAILTDATADIVEFFHDGGRFMAYSSPLSYDSATDIDTWTEYDFSATIPVFSTKIKVDVALEVKTADAVVIAYWRPENQTSVVNGNYLIGLERIGTDQTIHAGGIVVLTNAAQVIDVTINRSQADTITVTAMGWYFPNGM